MTQPGSRCRTQCEHTHTHAQKKREDCMTICSQHTQIQIYLIQVSRHGLYMSVKQVQIEIFGLIIHSLYIRVYNEIFDQQSHTTLILQAYTHTHIRKATLFSIILFTEMAKKKKKREL